MNRKTEPGQTATRCWDLDHVCESGRWGLEKEAPHSPRWLPLVLDGQPREYPLLHVSLIDRSYCGELVCFDVAPLKRGEPEPRTLWKVDMMKQFGVSPRSPSMGLGHTCSIAVHQDLIYVITGNGVGENWDKLPAPEAPSLLCFNKNTGATVWQDKSPGEIFSLANGSARW